MKIIYPDDLRDIRTYILYFIVYMKDASHSFPHRLFYGICLQQARIEFPTFFASADIAKFSSITSLEDYRTNLRRFAVYVGADSEERTGELLSGVSATALLDRAADDGSCLLIAGDRFQSPLLQFATMYEKVEVKRQLWAHNRRLRPFVNIRRTAKATLTIRLSWRMLTSERAGIWDGF